MATALPPGSRAPAIVQSLELVRDPFGFFDRRRARFGPVFRARLLGYPRFVYVAEPELARTVFATDRNVGRAGEVRREVMEPLVGPASLLCLEGERWLRHRKLVGPPLHGPRVEGHRERIAEIAAAEIDRWPLDRPFALRPRAAAITLEVILQVVFGVRDAAKLERLRALLPALIESGASAAVLGFLGGAGERIFESPLLRRVPRSPIARFWRLRAETDAMIAEEIARRRGESCAGSGDVLSLLLGARDDDGRGLDDGEIRDELVTVLEAGHETTATALAWTFERLVRNPTVLDRLRGELDAGREEYLDAVVKESLRARPVVVDAPRILVGPLEVGGYALPAGWYVAPAFPLVHSDRRRYPDPDRFLPERFLDGAVAPDAWIPFGGGKRRCVGSHLAMLELRTVVAEVIHRLDLSPTDPAPERPRLHHVTMVPADGAMVIARRRSAEAPPSRRRSAAPRARTEDGRSGVPTAPRPARAPGA